MMFVRVFVAFLLAVSLEHQWVLSQQLEFPQECSGETCVSKCCPPNQLVNLTSCDVPLNESYIWQPIFYNRETRQPLESQPRNFNYLNGFTQCESFPLQPFLNENDQFYLLPDGSLFVPLYKNTYSPGRYCIDSFKVSLDVVEEVALLCFEEPEEQPSTACQVVQDYVVPVLLMVSCFFLFITLTVYVCIPDLRGKLHGRCLMSMISSLLVAYILMSVVYLNSESMSPSACIFCASGKQMAILASFFWLNVMCFDIWRSLKSMRPAAETSARSRRRFLLYSLYAWGCPFIIGMVTLLIHNLPESYENVIRPNFLNSMQFCWFDSRTRLWIYFYMIILILVIANIVFFAMVAYILIKSQNNQNLKRARSQNRDRMWLYVRLFLVMGITWIAEVISWQEGTCEVWIVTDIINALQGFTIFLVFVCKKSTRQMVTKRLSKMKKPGSTSIRTRTTTFFTSMSKSSSSRGTESSSLSQAGESQSFTASTVSQHPKYGLQPPSQTTIIEETNEESKQLSKMDDDCPSMRGELPSSDTDTEFKAGNHDEAAVALVNGEITTDPAIEGSFSSQKSSPTICESMVKDSESPSTVSGQVKNADGQDQEELLPLINGSGMRSENTMNDKKQSED